ncbi:MAG: flagellar motor protein [Bacillota bacterium]|jgi:chemotaxis protein MotA|nr:flagellar motor protein [Bacillota bacterium]
MDITTLAGLVIGFAALIVAFILEGGTMGSLFSHTAGLIVIGGTIGATVLSFSLEELKTIPSLLKTTFQERRYNYVSLIQEIVRLADQARREGLLSLEQSLQEIEDPFLKLGLQLVIDGTEGTLLRDLLEMEVYCMEERHQNGIAIFEAAGGYAPTMGIIGTVMGLVHVLGNMESPEELGPAIAVAFIATLYGVSTANLIWLPIAAKLKNKSKKERIYRELALEGVLALHAGENPAFIREKLRVFLDQKSRALEAQGREE